MNKAATAFPPIKIPRSTFSYKEISFIPAPFSMSVNVIITTSIANIRLERWSNFWDDAMEILLSGGTIASDGFSLVLPHLDHYHWIFRSARTSYRAFDSRPVRPSVHPQQISWVHRWAETVPSGLRDPSNCIFYESWWCQLSKFVRKFKYRDKYKDKYRDKYKDRDK